MTAEAAFELGSQVAGYLDARHLSIRAPLEQTKHLEGVDTQRPVLDHRARALGPDDAARGTAPEVVDRLDAAVAHRAGLEAGTVPELVQQSHLEEAHRLVNFRLVVEAAESAEQQPEHRVRL